MIDLDIVWMMQKFTREEKYVKHLSCYSCLVWINYNQKARHIHVNDGVRYSKEFII